MNLRSWPVALVISVFVITVCVVVLLLWHHEHPDNYLPQQLPTI